MSDRAANTMRPSVGVMATPATRDPFHPKNDPTSAGSGWAAGVDRDADEVDGDEADRERGQDPRHVGRRVEATEGPDGDELDRPRRCQPRR